jgi:hypothetical protein
MRANLLMAIVTDFHELIDGLHDVAHLVSELADLAVVFRRVAPDLVCELADLAIMRLDGLHQELGAFFE